MTSPSSLKLSSCIALGAAVLMMASCGKKQDTVSWWQGEQERIELSQEIALKKFRFEQLDSADFAELEGIRRHSTIVGSRIVSLKGHGEELRGQIDSLETKWQDYKEVVLDDHRRNAVGKSFETLRLASGREYEKVSVASIDDGGVTIHHSYGTARLRFDDLDSRQRVFFGLDADLALAAREKEAQDAAAYERWVRNQVAAAATAKVAQENATAARLRKMADQERRSSELADQIVASNNRTLAQPAKSFGNRYSSYRSSYRSYSPTYRYVYYGVPNCYNYNPNRIVAYPPVRYPSWYANKISTPGTRSFSNTTIPSIP